MVKKICIITTTRAEYGLLSRIINLIKNSSKLELYLIIGGTHLSEKYGNTITDIDLKNIENYFFIDYLDEEDNKLCISNSMAKFQYELGLYFDKVKPDLVLVLGDRYELLTICSTALLFDIPIAHIGGGQITEGAIDDSVRHAVSKLSNIHFVSNNIFKKRLMQLGENEQNIFITGSTGIDNVLHSKKYSLQEIEKIFFIKLMSNVALVTLHTETRYVDDIKKNVKVFFKALSKIKNTTFFCSYPNCDFGSEIIIKELKKFGKNNNVIIKENFGAKMYLSIMKISTVVIGNSSSGIIEAASMKIPTINVGRRQHGRLCAKNVIHVVYNHTRILQAFHKVHSKYFINSLKFMKNPYGNGTASNKIVKVIEEINIPNIKIKKFKDIR